MRNPLGIHALVWSGYWKRNDIDFAIGKSSKLGFDIIEIPLLNANPNPKSFKTLYTRKRGCEVTS